jgi:hypothetical protein
VRRFISISLLLLFTLPLVSPLFAASTADASVPVCCRRDGRHHCMLSLAAPHSSSGDTGTRIASLHERCPYNLTAPLAINLSFVPDEILTTISAGSVGTSACPAETEVCVRSCFNRSHQKRGPPSLLLSRS